MQTPLSPPSMRPLPLPLAAHKMLLSRSDFLRPLTPSPPLPPPSSSSSLLLQTVKEERTWCVRTESSELQQALLAWVRAQWEAMFGIKLHTSSSLQDGAT